MVHSISQNNSDGRVEIQVQKLQDEKKVMISIIQFDHETIFNDHKVIVLDDNQFYDLIGTMLFVQSNLKK